MPLSPSVLQAVFVAFLGLCAGSFLNAYVYRLSNGIEEGMLDGHSFCPHCKAQLQARDLVPLLSFAWLRGRCRYCHQPISWRYPLVEAGCVLVFLTFALTQGGSDPVLFGLGLGIMYILYALGVYDAQTMEVPLAPIGLGIFLALVAIGYQTWISGSIAPLSITIVPLGIALAFFGLQIGLSRGRWMGMGDLYVGIFLALILSWQQFLLMLMAAYVSGALVALPMIIRKQRGKKLPLVPFLSLGAFVAICFGQDILSWYAGLLGFG